MINELTIKQIIALKSLAEAIEEECVTEFRKVSNKGLSTREYQYFREQFYDEFVKGVIKIYKSRGMEEKRNEISSI